MEHGTRPAGSGDPQGIDYRAVFEALPGRLLVLWPDLSVAAVSDRYLDVTGTERDAVVGRSIFDVFTDASADVEVDGVRDLRASLHLVRTALMVDAIPLQRFSVRRPDARGGGFEARYWSLVNAPVLDDRGELAFIVHRVEDVTDLVRLRHKGAEHDELTDELRKELGFMVADVFALTQEAVGANRELKEANAELARLYERTLELDRLKSQLFANVSHELRTPLTLLLGPAELLLEADDLGDERRRLVEVIRREATLLLALVEDLLEAARLDADAVVLGMSEVDLAELARLTTLHFEPDAQERGIELHVCAEHSVVVPADPGRIARVLRNLLSNALKFTPQGGSIRVEVRADLARRRGVIEVADSGPGIDFEDRQTVFDRFFQVEGGSDRHFGGTGLGLSISRELVELHHGTIEVTRAPEGGTLVTLELPLDVESTTQVARARDLVQVVESLRQNGPSDLFDDPAGQARADEDTSVPLVLIIEDNVDLSSFLARTLSRDYRVRWVATGPEGLDLARGEPPSLVVLDVMLPGMTGEEVLAEIRADPQLSSTPVVVLTAKADHGLRVRMLRGGADDFVMKPFVIEELRARIANVLATRAEIDQLDGALQSRVVIEQAKGMLAAERQITVEDAFDALRTHARQRGVKLHDVAHAVVRLGLRP